MVYNKLVRDKIPEIMAENGTRANTRILAGEEYLGKLREKLSEEVSEYLESGEIEELADILEVVYALCEAEGHTKDELFSIFADKHAARGGFSKRILLISNENE